jgi:hypothetical protein
VFDSLTSLLFLPVYIPLIARNPSLTQCASAREGAVVGEFSTYAGASLSLLAKKALQNKSRLSQKNGKLVIIYYGHWVPAINEKNQCYDSYHFDSSPAPGMANYLVRLRLCLRLLPYYTAYQLFSNKQKLT